MNDEVTILLAEDNPENITTMSDYLSFKGYRVVLALNGLEALEKVQSDHPSLILMDIQMPKMDGLEAIRNIRQNSSLDSIPIVALTALAMNGDRERCLAAGANEYLSKPVRLRVLAETIEGLLA
ncbi:MAG: response regulator [Chloroflexota bacterium]